MPTIKSAAASPSADTIVGMHCNIDAKGKAVRLILGAVAEGIGLLLLTLAAVGMIDGRWPWIVGGVALTIGFIGIFESLAGWCVLRAMGFKTKV